MEVIKEKLHKNFSRDNYWTRIFLKSKEKDKKTTVYICASHEYLGEKLKTSNLTDTAISGWVDTVAEEWQSKGMSVFRKPMHFTVCAMTDDGYKNGLNFLKTEVVVES